MPSYVTAAGVLRAQPEDMQLQKLFKDRTTIGLSAIGVTAGSRISWGYHTEGASACQMQLHGRVDLSAAMFLIDGPVADVQDSLNILGPAYPLTELQLELLVLTGYVGCQLDFENPPYVAGVILGQDGWIAGPLHTGGQLLITAVAAMTGAQHVRWNALGAPGSILHRQRPITGNAGVGYGLRVQVRPAPLNPTDVVRFAVRNGAAGALPWALRFDVGGLISLEVNSVVEDTGVAWVNLVNEDYEVEVDSGTGEVRLYVGTPLALAYTHTTAADLSLMTIDRLDVHCTVNGLTTGANCGFDMMFIDRAPVLKTGWIYTTP